MGQNSIDDKIEMNAGEFALACNQVIKQYQSMIQQINDMYTEAEIYKQAGYNVKYYLDNKTGEMTYVYKKKKPIGFNND